MSNTRPKKISRKVEPKSESYRCTFELRYDGMPDAIYGGIGLFLMTEQVAVSLSIAASGASLVKLLNRRSAVSC